MNNDSKISGLSICFLSSFLYRSFYIIGFFNLIISISKSDSIFSIIFGSVLGIILLYIYFYLNNRHTSENIFEKVNSTLPKIISIFINTLLIVLFTFIASFILYNLSLFINYNLLNDIDIIPISTLLILTSIYLVSKGINTLTRVSGILIFIFILLAIISFIALTNYSSPSNLYPLLTNSFTTITKGGVCTTIISITPIFLLLIIPKDKIESNKKYKRYMLTTYIVNAFYLLISFILILSILGIELTSILKYSDIVALQKVSLLNFIQRIEDLLSFKVMFDSFISLSLILFYVKEGITYIYKIKPNKKIVLAVGIITLILSLYLKTTNINLVFYLLSIILFIHLLLMLFIRKNPIIKNKTTGWYNSSSIIFIILYNFF